MFAFACLRALACTRLSAIARKHPCVLAEGTPLRSGMLADWLAGLFGLRACLFACAVVLDILVRSVGMLADWAGIQSFDVTVLISSGLGC